MAIFRTGPIVNAVSGAVGGIVFVVGNGASVIRPRSRKTAARAPAYFGTNTDWTAIWQLVTRSWADRSDAARLTWVNAATLYRTTSRLGQERPLSPFQLYCLFETSRYPGFGLSTSGFAPNEVAPALVIDSMAFEEGGPFTVTTTVATSTVAYATSAYGGAAQHARPARFPPPLRLYDAFFTADATTNTYPNWSARIPTPRAGQRAWLRLRNVGPALLPGPIIQASTVVQP